MQGKVPRSLLFHSSFIEACRKKKKKKCLEEECYLLYLTFHLQRDFIPFLLPVIAVEIYLVFEIIAVETVTTPSPYPTSSY